MPRDARSIMDLNGGIKYKVAYSNKKVNTCTIALSVCSCATIGL